MSIDAYCNVPEPQPVVLAVPEFDGEAITIDTSGMPDPYEFVPVGDGPEITLPAMPEAFDYTRPPDPSLIDIHVPDFDPLAPIDVAITIPDVDIGDLKNGLQWANADFDVEQLLGIQEQLDRVRQGDFAITSGIWHQIYNQSAQRTQREGLAKRRQARTHWANLGWGLPGGVAFAGEEEAQRTVYEETAKHSLEVATQEAKQKDEQFWKATAEGIKLEAQLHEINQALNDRRLKYAIALQEASVATYNALANALNLEIARVNAKVQAVGLEIEAQKAELSNRKMRLDAAIARGEVNKNAVEVYKAHWDGIKAAADAYTAEVQAIGANVEAQKAAVEAHGLKVSQKKMEVDTWAAQVDAYGKKMQAQSIKVDYFGQMVNRYSARISAYDVQVRGLETGERSKGDLAQARASCSSAAASWHKADVDRAIGELQHQATLAQQVIDRYEVDVKNKDVDHRSGFDYAKLGQDFTLGKDELAVRREDIGVRNTLGWAGFTNNLDVEWIKCGCSKEVAHINGQWGYDTAALSTGYQIDVANIRAAAQRDAAAISADATKTAACTSANATVTAAYAGEQSRVAIANADSDTRVGIANADGAAKVAIANADSATRIAVAAAQAEAQLQAARISAEAQLGAAEANSYSFSESRSVTRTDGSNTNYAQYQSENRTDNRTMNKNCSEATYYNTYHSEEG